VKEQGNMKKQELNWFLKEFLH